MKKFSIFVSYSHKDRKYQTELASHLEAWVKTNKGTVWHDGEIMPGAEWKPAIDRALARADIILLLISVSFINSKFIGLHEFKQALRRHNLGTARVIPVLVRTVAFFERYPFGKLQALPSNGKPIEKWQRTGDACANVIEGLDRALVELKNPNGRRKKAHAGKKTPAESRA